MLINNQTRTRSKPKLQHTLRQMRAQIELGLWTRGEKLPSIIHLSKSFGVSPTLIEKALHHLREEGILLTKPGSGTTLTETLKPTVPVKALSLTRPRSTLRWQRLKTELLQSLEVGKYASTTQLPSCTQLAQILRCDARTLSKTLKALVQEGILRREKRGYQILRAKQTRTLTALAFLNLEGFVGERQAYNPRIRDFTLSLLSQCQAKGLNFYPLPFSPQTLDQVLKQLKSLPLMGIVVWLGEGMASREREAHAQALRKLQSLRKPLSLFDELGDWPTQLAQARSAPTRFFRIAMKTAGFRLGRYLLEQGHRHVTYCSITHSSTWSKTRLAGLAQAFAEFGLAPTTLITQVLPSPHTVLTLPPPTPSFNATILAHQFTRLGQAHSALEWKRWDHHSRLWRMFSGRMGDFCSQFNCRATAEPLFVEALQQKKVSAWVCANDPLALAAMEFLRREKSKKKSGISVVGFDDSPQAYDEGLASYNFDFPGLALAMLNFILNPSIAIPMRSEVMEMPGMVAHRESLRSFSQARKG